MALNIDEKGFIIPKTLSVRKKWKKTWVAGVRHGKSPVVCRVWPDRVIVVFFWAKYAVPRKIQHGILRLTIRRGQSILSIVFIFVICEERGYYRVVSVGQLSFHWRSYCGLSCRMQVGGWKRDPGCSWLRDHPETGWKKNVVLIVAVANFLDFKSSSSR